MFHRFFLPFSSGQGGLVHQPHPISDQVCLFYKFVTQPSKLTQNYCRLSHLGYRKEHAGLKRGKAGFSDEYLDKLDSETRDSLQENGDAAGEGEPDLRWERLRLSDGDLLGASRDPDFEKLKVINYYTQRGIPSPK